MPIQSRWPTMSCAPAHSLARMALILSTIAMLLPLATAKTPSSPCDIAEENVDTPAWIENGGILLIFVVVLVMFWALALVCEEYFVPALNVLCEELKIPDDVAGATFMAAGASSPELFTAFIALIVYDSNIGVGTVVGSEIFNHMIISAGSVLFAKKGTLHLDARIVCRDLFFYMLSLFVLIYSLKDDVFVAFEDTFDIATWDECLDVTLVHGIVLVLVYIVYAIVAGSYERLVGYMCPRVKPETHASSLPYGTGSEAGAGAAGGSGKEEHHHAPHNMMAYLSIASTDRDDTRIHTAVGSLSRTASIDAATKLEMSNPVRDLDTALVDDVALLQSTLEYSIDAADVHEAVLALEQQNIDNLDLNPGMIRRNSELKKTIRSSRHGSRKNSLSEPATVLSPLQRAVRGQTMSEDEMKEARREYRKNFRKVGSVTCESVVYAVPDQLKPKGAERVKLFIMDALPPADVATIKKGEGCYKCYLHVLQDCIRLDALPAWMTWQMRYFVVDEHGLYSYDSPNMPQTGPHVQVVDLSTATDVQINNPDTFLFTIHFHNVVVPAIQFRAPCQEIMDAMVERIGSLIKDMKKKVDAEKILHIGAAEEALWHEPHAHEMGGGDAHAHSIIDAPSGRYPFMWHCLVYPLKLAFHYTLVDCRTPSMRRYYVQVNLICVVYLGILSYVMILCCDTIGNYLGTTPTVMGLTLSAIGTSFPNMWSSMVVARQGYGNMAICNALGSNIFNICVALGLPWATLVMMHHGKAYDEMKDHGIVMFVLLLEAVCVIWIAMIALSGFKLRAWMAPIFVILYLAVLVLAVTLSNV